MQGQIFISPRLCVFSQLAAALNTAALWLCSLLHAKYLCLISTCSSSTSAVEEKNPQLCCAEILSLIFNVLAAAQPAVQTSSNCDLHEKAAARNLQNFLFSLFLLCEKELLAGRCVAGSIIILLQSAL